MASTKPNTEKLLVKPGSALMAVNPPPGFDALIGPLPRGVTVRGLGQANSDVILFFAESRAVLEAQLAELKAFLEPGGVIWIVYRKGTAKPKSDINRDSINAYAKTQGMAGIAMVSLDDTWSALRLRIDR
jgi:hypothetical protein